MPTGYTAAVQNGKITEFRDFALSCARAFGACIEMRDDPSDAPIPEKFEPVPWYAERVSEARTELDRIRSMSASDKEAAFQKDRADAAEQIETWTRERAEQRARYEAMLKKVEAWAPPTASHVEFHNFMLKQLRESIEHDCGSWVPSVRSFTTSEVWWRTQLKDTLEGLARAEEGLEKEIERQARRSKWIADLRASLTLEAV